MYRIYDDGTFEIVRGDTAEFSIVPQEYSQVEEPSVEDLNLYYEFVNGAFVPTADKTVDPNKNYYILSEYELQEGDRLTFTVKKNTKTSDILIQKTGPIIKIESEDTEVLPYGSYKYDVEFSTSDRGVVDTIIEPTVFKITEEVTF